MIRECNFYFWDNLKNEKVLKNFLENHYGGRPVTHFMSLVSFNTPWKQRFSDVFRGYRKKLVAWNGLSNVESLQFYQQMHPGKNTSRKCYMVSRTPFLMFCRNYVFLYPLVSQKLNKVFFAYYLVCYLTFLLASLNKYLIFLCWLRN